MIAPCTSLAAKQLIWHIHSSQAYGVSLLIAYRGALRPILSADTLQVPWSDVCSSRLCSPQSGSSIANIDTANCPVFMLTGEYDWSTTPAAAETVAAAIPGAIHKTMPKLGQFPAAESPDRFIPFLLEAIDHVQRIRSENLSTMRLGTD